MDHRLSREQGRRTLGGALKARREKVAQCLRKGLRSPTAIAKVINEPVRAVRGDKRYLERESDQWLFNLAMGGYIHDVQNAVQALEDLEVQLYALRDRKEVTDKPWLYLKVVKLIQENLAMRINIETKGPLLLKLKQVRDKIKQAEAIKAKLPEVSDDA